ncbi:MAG: asparagine synthase-related protein [Luteolibacter sp.]
MGKAKPVSFEAALDEANDLLASALRRHLSGRCLENLDSLFSGGLDSRLVLAYLTKMNVFPRCRTHGFPTDDEVILAKRASRKIGCEWTGVPDDFTYMEPAARAEVGLFSLGSGMSSLFLMMDVLRPEPKAEATVNGFALDTVFDRINGIEDFTRGRSFEEEFQRKMNNFGIPPEQLKRLFRSPEQRDAVDAAIEEMKEEWNGLSEDPLLRIWQTTQHFRTSHHIGGVVWKNSFASWPVSVGYDLPMLRRLLEFPVEMYEKRKLQREMLAKINPALARIPLDGNSRKPMPVIDTFVERLKRSLRRRRGRGQRRKGGGIETRRYVRMLDVNNEAWADLRRTADAKRASLERIFDSGELNEYFPPFPQRVPIEKDPIGEHAGRRMLVGLALYLDPL